MEENHQPATEIPAGVDRALRQLDRARVSIPCDTTESDEIGESCEEPERARLRR